MELTNHEAEALDEIYRKTIKMLKKNISQDKRLQDLTQNKLAFSVLLKGICEELDGLDKQTKKSLVSITYNIMSLKLEE